MLGLNDFQWKIGRKQIEVMKIQPTSPMWLRRFVRLKKQAKMVGKKSQIDQRKGKKSPIKNMR